VSTAAAALLVAGAIGACGDEDTDAAGIVTDTETDVLTDTVTDTVTDVVTDTAVVTATVTRDDDVADDEGETDVAFPANTGTDTGDLSGDPVLFTDLRIGRHKGFDRVVWEFAGGGSPGWRVGYADDPTEQGSGMAVDLPGDATLEVTITNVGLPGDVDVPRGVDFYDGPRTLAAGSTEWVTEVRPGTLFEGILQGFVGVEEEVPFRVYLLEDPTRLVLEVRGP
jgi:hypothetical protein